MLIEKTISNYSVMDLDQTELQHIFQDGRISSIFLEKQIPKWLYTPRLKNTVKDYSTYVDEQKQKYLLRMFTRQGAKFMPSRQIGTCRQFNQAETQRLVRELKIILCDVTEFPKVKIKIELGSDLIRSYPTAMIPYSHKSRIFR